ncbi:hypothetical protein LOAG_00258 [Loa loa]|uniref:Uncharacterized protein n=1 Tax=Loa loa TaxID=7209 RepID=A0A1S0UC50_LOALO|nr:hypothetical protein LOAG_00258 [Loa loa]EFO28230.1 hypothetical protein LOAG_00258 [Loa loa]
MMLKDMEMMEQKQKTLSQRNSCPEHPADPISFRTSVVDEMSKMDGLREVNCLIVLMNNPFMHSLLPVFNRLITLLVLLFLLLLLLPSLIIAATITTTATTTAAAAIIATTSTIGTKTTL